MKGAPTVVLHPGQCELSPMKDVDYGIAVECAKRLVMSPHEWTWTQDEQEKMARFVLWAHQRLCGIAQLASGPLGHARQEDK